MGKKYRYIILRNEVAERVRVQVRKILDVFEIRTIKGEGLRILCISL